MIKLINTETEELNESQIAKINRELGKDYIGLAIMECGRPIGLNAGMTFELLPEKYAAFVNMESD